MGSAIGVGAASTRPFPNLLEPVTISGCTMRNRVVMGSMHTGLEERPGGFEKLAAFYADRARGGVGLIVTGGMAPNQEGALFAGAASFTTEAQVADHALLTAAVHAQGGKICLQILHAGRYAAHAQAVAPSPLQASIVPFAPREMTEADIERTLGDYVRCAALANQAGYDGVEVMGSEGYLINQFTTPRTNHRTDRWGGGVENRQRFAVEVVRRVRECLGPDFLLIYRLSLLDLVEGGSTWDEVSRLARAVEAAGASLISSGFGWHESRVPTIAARVPPAAFAWATRRLKGVVRIPLVASNRINTPELAETLLARGDADLVSMARPLLADPEFVIKAARGDADAINTCIACNQGCLDFIFNGQPATCLVNPRACRELEWAIDPAPVSRKVAVVGAGPAGMAAACVAAERGHDVTLFEREPVLGGQFNLACRVPGKDGYRATVRYFRERLKRAGVMVRLGCPATEDRLQAEGFVAVVLASGVVPREVDFPGCQDPRVVSYDRLLSGQVPPGRRVAVIGAGGIGFDVCEYLTQETESQDALRQYQSAWGIDSHYAQPGGLGTIADAPQARQVWLLQRKPGRPGARLGKTTGWIVRSALARHRVAMWGGVEYVGLIEAGLQVRVNGVAQCLPVDQVVICAGQEPRDELCEPLKAAGLEVHRVGGAREARELDALRAIEEGMRVAARL